MSTSKCYMTCVCIYVCVGLYVCLTFIYVLLHLYLIIFECRLIDNMTIVLCIYDIPVHIHMIAQLNIKHLLVF